MYFPYFRGKQYELFTIRESARLICDSEFTPVIEPVRETSGGLVKTLDEIVKCHGKAIIVANPDHGNYKNDSNGIAKLLKDKYADYKDISLGILLNEKITLNEIQEILVSSEDRASSFIHAGYTGAKSLAESLGKNLGKYDHIFLEDKSGKLYQRYFKSKTSKRILLRDGFRRRPNRAHPSKEYFSDLHVTFEDEGMQGFGDFLIVGDYYSETGGPAYAVAIHLTFIDRSKDDEMHIQHFKSIRQDDPKDPAGKFAEALQELINEIERPDTQIFRSSAIDEFSELYERGHFPGLGYVKKLSMKHHIETLADYFGRQK